METIRKINYYKESLIELEKIKNSGIKPSIALHACCGPCSAYPIEFLVGYFSKVTILFDNSNIYPFEEYSRRKDELIRYVNIFNDEHNTNVEVVVFDYDNESYNEMLDEYGDMDEGLSRCFKCYRTRMENCYKYAEENGYDYFCTVMTISRQKSSQVMNQIGIDLSKKYKTKYFLSDFKKNKGIDRAREIRIEYNMYNQQYCGCIYSYNRYLKRKEKENL